MLDIIAQVADALDYAHANRVIHRDVKPANILITADNRVKITDFGIARLDSSNLTQEGQLLGTPNYMAPEQIQGKEVDHRADLFSLGVVLYEMLTRHKPFQGENLTVVSHRIVYDHFTPPREYAPGPAPRGSTASSPGRWRRTRPAATSGPRRWWRTCAGWWRRRPRRDDLNETQSLSSTMVLPPLRPPSSPPGPAAAAAGSPGHHGSPARPLAALPPSAHGSRGRRLPARTARPALPPPDAGPAARLPRRRPRGPPTLSRTPWHRGAGLSRPPDLAAPLLVAGGSALAVVSPLWAAVWLWAGWSQPAGPQRSAKEDGNRQKIIELLRAGKQARDIGDWKGAAALFYQAGAARSEREKDPRRCASRPRSAPASSSPSSPARQSGRDGARRREQGPRRRRTTTMP